MSVPVHVERASTRMALVTAALELFGDAGFAAVSTRALAERAGANLAAIQYHFGGKDALYCAVIDHIVETLSPRVDAAIQVFETQRTHLARRPDLQSAVIARVVSLLANAFLAEPGVRRFMPFVLRELVHPGPHFDRFYAALPARIHRMLSEFIGLIRDEPADSAAVLIQTHAVVGQLIVFHVGREILLRRTGWDDYNAARISQIVAVLVASLQRTLGLPETPATGSALPSVQTTVPQVHPEGDTP